MTPMLNLNLQTSLENLPQEPGVYRMLGEGGQVLYVGKAFNLKKRVSGYFRQQSSSTKIKSLVSQIVDIEISVTRSETEALLLESNLIKTLQPKYNVLLRDDKSYPFIHITSQHDFPRIEMLRCKKKPEQGDFFGPYPNVAAVRETIHLIQKVFHIRNCSDAFYRARSRPCLQYQIKRCSAPCTAYISKEDYQQALLLAKRFLQGKSQQILDELESSMQQAVTNLAYEEAAVIRDKIQHLRVVQEQQSMVQVGGDVDVIVLVARPGFACVQCVHIRKGDIISSHSFFPSVPELTIEQDESLWQQVFEAFIAYYYVYLPDRIPGLILTNQAVLNTISLQTMLSDLRGRPCQIKTVLRGVKLRWIDFALNNLKLAVIKHETKAETMKLRLTALQDFIQGPKPIKRMECFDISHTQGHETVASCVVFDEHGPCKREYRRFNIKDITKGDDYAAMEQVLIRRFQRLAKTKQFPDLVVIDGGKGQVCVAKRVMKALDIQDVLILGIAKGPARKAGWERLILADDVQERTLPMDSKALQLLQYIRDEAHRFAIKSHRSKRHQSSLQSSLESLPGIGPKRRQALLYRFGGLQALTKAPMDEISKVRGISHDLAVKIYEHFHDVP